LTIPAHTAVTVTVWHSAAESNTIPKTQNCHTCDPNTAVTPEPVTNWVSVAGKRGSLVT